MTYTHRGDEFDPLQVGYDVPVVDPAVTPGRLNFYSIEQMLAGNLRPTLLPDQIAAPLNTNIRVYFACRVDATSQRAPGRAFFSMTPWARAQFGAPVFVRAPCRRHTRCLFAER